CRRAAGTGTHLSRSAGASLPGRTVAAGNIRGHRSTGTYSCFKNLSRPRNPAISTWGRIMRTDIHGQFQRLHEEFQSLIDESLAGGITAEKERLLRDHLHDCGLCTEYLSASNRVIS